MNHYYTRISTVIGAVALLLSLNVKAQYHAQRPAALKANSRWFFGEYGINFNQQPQAIPTPEFLAAFNATAFQSTFKNTVKGTRNPNVIPVSHPVSGDLRFVALETKIFNRNFAELPNGDFSDRNVPAENFEKNILIAPVMNDPDRYFHFMLSAEGDSLVLARSIINMTLNNGLGDIEADSKNTIIRKFANTNVITELIDVIPGNNCDFWLVLSENKVNFEAAYSIQAFHITIDGIDPNPVVSRFEKTNPNVALWDYQFSPDRALLSIISYDVTNTISFLKFNLDNGTTSISVYPDIKFPGAPGSYDVHGAFTPDNGYFIAYNNVIRDKNAIFYKYDFSAYNVGYRVDSFSYPISTYKPFDRVTELRYVPAAILFKPYDNKLFSNIPESIRTEDIIAKNEYGKPYYNITAYSSIKLVPFGPPGSLDSWRQFSFSPEINLSRSCRLFTNSTINYPYLAGDTIPTVYDSVLCLAPDEPFPSVTLKAKAGFNNYTWNDGTTGTEKHINQPGKYWVLYKGSCNYRVDTFNYRLWVPTKVLPPDTTVCEQRLPIPIVPTKEGEYRWLDINTNEPARNINQAGTYTVEFKDFGCTQLDSITVHSKFCPCELGLPNAFTPNGDGLNDYFKPVMTLGCVPSGYTLRIFNRWGQLVYSSFNEFDMGWDGTYNSGLAAPGSYFYEIKFKSRFLDDPYYQKGELILVR